jgi:ribonuclease Z
MMRLRASAAVDTHVSEDVRATVESLAGITLALLAGDEAAAAALAGGAEQKRETVRKALAAYDVCESGTLSRDEAEALFANLARSIVTELASGTAGSDLARANARRVLEDDKRGTIARVASKLLLLADVDGDGKVSLPELASLFDVVQGAHKSPGTFPKPLRALAGSLQLLPPSEGRATAEAERAAEWHVGVPGEKAGTGGQCGCGGG